MDKWCNGCNRSLDISEFWKDKYKYDGKSSMCKECKDRKRKEYLSNEENRINARKRSREWHHSNKERAKTHALKRKFGITYEQYMEMYNAHFGLCEICKQRNQNPKKFLAVDHDHITGKIRGLLCENCNKALGLIRDNVEILEQMIHYLNKQKG